MIKNNWYVLTGGPCSGKTTTIDFLRDKGYRVVYEAARTLIDQEMKKGRTLREIRKNELAFQKRVLEMKIELEKELPKEETIFFERGIPDSTAYYAICEVTNDQDLASANENCAYKKVFLLELLEYQKDYARTEDKETALRIEKLLEEAYRSLNIPVVKVPIMPVRKRVDFILNNL